ncbi:MAG: AraC family transcriptional regulator [Candidatus Pelagadaptatus aseana]|uniref:AraC family transcriptional regulator n=1 Tax=Candidatus Pelagadaptatus aseana TaxID=3120508 RepID=UPI0039B2031B
MPVPNPQWSVYAATVNSLVQVANMLGLPTKDLLQQVGIESSQLQDPESRIPITGVFEFYDLLVRESASDDVGLYTGRVFYTNGLNLQLYMGTICRTFREYLNLMPSLLRFAGDIGEVKVKRQGEVICLNWVPLSQESRSHRFLSDMVLANSAYIIDTLCVQPIRVEKACFTYPKPADTGLLKTLFGDNLHFDQPFSCLYYDSQSLDYPLTKTGFDLNQAVSHQVQHLFRSEGDDGDQFLLELKSCLMKLLPTGETGIDAVAKELGVSRRTLQRRLGERDSPFSQVLQTVRSELAFNYLADQHLGITDIAFLLGYGDQSSFSSAFKSWCGKSPSEYRQG